MHEDDISVIVMLFGVSLMVLAAFYGCYWMGKTIERRGYTAAYMEQIEAAYREGYMNGRGITE